MSGTGSHRESATHRHWSPIINCQLRSLRSNYTQTHTHTARRSHGAARMSLFTILMPVPKSLEATCSPLPVPVSPVARSGWCAALLYPGTAAPCCAWLVLAWLVAGGWPTLHAQNYLWSEVLVMGIQWTRCQAPAPHTGHHPDIPSIHTENTTSRPSHLNVLSSPALPTLCRCRLLWWRQ